MICGQFCSNRCIFLPCNIIFLFWLKGKLRKLRQINCLWKIIILHLLRAQAGSQQLVKKSCILLPHGNFKLKVLDLIVCMYFICKTFILLFFSCHYSVHNCKAKLVTPIRCHRNRPPRPKPPTESIPLVPITSLIKAGASLNLWPQK